MVASSMEFEESSLAKIHFQNSPHSTVVSEQSPLSILRISVKMFQRHEGLIYLTYGIILVNISQWHRVTGSAIYCQQLHWCWYQWVVHWHQYLIPHAPCQWYQWTPHWHQYLSLFSFYSIQKVAGKFPAIQISLIFMIETWGLPFTGTCFLCY